MKLESKLNFMIVTIILGLVIPSIVSGQSDGIDGRCEEKWEDNREMQQHCREQQTDAKRWVRRFDEKYDGSKRMTTLKKCKDKWSDRHGHNWKMVKHCTEKQMEAAKEIQESNNTNTSPKIAERCRQKWEDNYQMREHCQDEQKDAKEWVNNSFNPDDSSAKRALLTRCRRKWNDGPGYNWKMVKHCIEKDR